MQDADQAAGQSSEDVVCAQVPWRAGVVEGTGTGRDPQCSEGLAHQRVDEPIVAHVPSGTYLLPRLLRWNGAR